MKRLRVRRETVTALAVVSSEEDMLATEEVLERGVGCMVAGEIEAV